MEDEIILLEDENGEQIECISLGTFDLNEKTYGAFVQVMPDGTESDDVIILECRPIEDGEYLNLFPVEDDDELEKAFNEFTSIYYAEGDEE